MEQARSESDAPELLLARAIKTEAPDEKRALAARGLELNEEDDPELECLLLRQLYLAALEEGHFEEALVLAERVIEVGELGDVARQDAARVCLALGDVDAAVGHLRIAGRVSPPSRRAFHDWSLGTVLYLEGRPEDAIPALSRAARWATTQKPLYEALLGLARRASGHGEPNLAELREQLEDSDCLTGYGELVLGELCVHLGEHGAARRHLRGFVDRIAKSRRAKTLTLAGELEHATRLLRGLGSGPPPRQA
jgi:tetratricopeptide (TPR) repeat protein